MASVASYNDLINRVAGNFTLNEPFWGELQSSTGILGGNQAALALISLQRDTPSLPAGVTSYIPTTIGGAWSASSGYPLLVCQCINLGSLDISGPTFTDGSQMPTVTELGVSRQTSGMVLMEITTALGATPGAITITYVDQNGNAAETTTAQNLPVTNPNIHTVGAIVLNAGDIGVRDITSATRTGGTAPTGVVKFWGCLPIALCCSDGSGNIFTENLLTNTFLLSQLPAATKIAYFAYGGGNSITARAVHGNMYIIGDS